MREGEGGLQVMCFALLLGGHEGERTKKRGTDIARFEARRGEGGGRSLLTAPWELQNHWLHGCHLLQRRQRQLMQLPPLLPAPGANVPVPRHHLTSPEHLRGRLPRPGREDRHCQRRRVPLGLHHRCRHRHRR